MKDDGSITTNPAEILKEQQMFYENLLESQYPKVDDPKFNFFFENDRIVKLNDG